MRRRCARRSRSGGCGPARRGRCASVGRCGGWRSGRRRPTRVPSASSTRRSSRARGRWAWMAWLMLAGGRGAVGGDGHGPPGVDVAPVGVGDPAGEQGGVGGVEPVGARRSARRRGVAASEPEAGVGFPRLDEAAGVSSSWWGTVSHQWANTPPRPTAGSWAGSPTATIRQCRSSGEVRRARRGPGWRPCRPRRRSRSSRPATARRRAVAVAGEEPGEGVGRAAGLDGAARRRPCRMARGRSTGRSRCLEVVRRRGRWCGSCRSRPGRPPATSCAGPAMAAAASAWRSPLSRVRRGRRGCSAQSLELAAPGRGRRRW